MLDIVAILPMRAGSVRVPDKNIRSCAGRPLYQYVLDVLLSCELIDQVVIDSDCPIILDQLKNDYDLGQRSDLIYQLRPEHLRAGHVSMNDVLMHVVGQVKASLYLQTHSTNPLLREPTIEQAIQAFRSDHQADTLFSVTEWKKRFYDEKGQAINHDPGVLLPTQQLPAYYEENSCLYLFTEESLNRTGRRIGERPMLFEMNAVEAFDIDGWAEFALAEAALLGNVIQYVDR